MGFELSRRRQQSKYIVAEAAELSGEIKAPIGDSSSRRALDGRRRCSQALNRENLTRAGD
jgi:hypothetical protein